MDTGLEDKGPLPTHMLALMGLLDTEGSRFCNKMVITVMGGHDKGLVYNANSNATLLDGIRSFFSKSI